jgi:hypothetical protein
MMLERVAPPTHRRWYGPVTALALAACGPATAPVFPTASELPDKDRQPDAVAVDLPSQPPPAGAQARSDAQVVALRSPLGVAAAHDTVRAFFRAVIREDVGALSALLVPTAQVVDVDPAAGGSAVSSPRARGARSWWNQRFRKHDYPDLGTRVVYRESDIETYRFDDLPTRPISSASLGLTRIDEMQRQDLLLRVPIVTTSVRSQRLLGSELYFWLRRDGDRFVVYRIGEPFPF